MNFRDMRSNVLFLLKKLLLYLQKVLTLGDALKVTIQNLSKNRYLWPKIWHTHVWPCLWRATFTHTKGHKNPINESRTVQSKKISCKDNNSILFVCNICSWTKYYKQLNILGLLVSTIMYLISKKMHCYITDVSQWCRKVKNVGGAGIKGWAESAPPRWNRVTDLQTIGGQLTPPRPS